MMTVTRTAWASLPDSEQEHLHILAMERGVFLYVRNFDGTLDFQLAPQRLWLRWLAAKSMRQSSDTK